MAAIEGSLFFIPSYSARFFESRVRVRPSVDLWTSLRAVHGTGGVTALDRLHGNDHFIVQPRNGATYKRQPF